MPSDLALLSTLMGLNYPCLELIFMVSKVFEPLEFDWKYHVSTSGIDTNIQSYARGKHNFRVEQCPRKILLILTQFSHLNTVS